MDYDISELNRVCRIAFDKNLLDTHSGNISRGIGAGRLLISKTGSSLIDPQMEDFTIIRAVKNTAGTEAEETSASSEKEIHRFILQSFPCSTVFHSHPFNAVALTLTLSGTGTSGNNKRGEDKTISGPEGEASQHGAQAAASAIFPAFRKLSEAYPKLYAIKPLDFESAYFFPEIYVLPLNLIEDIKSGSLKSAVEAKDLFGENGVFMIESHGSFSWGKNPLDALRWTMVLEYAAKVIMAVRR